jgi:hypothetical protein
MNIEQFVPIEDKFRFRTEITSMIPRFEESKWVLFFLQDINHVSWNLRKGDIKGTSKFGTIFGLLVGIFVPIPLQELTCPDYFW